LTASALTPHEAEAVATFFEGDERLFLAFRQTCMDQFGHDVVQADQACMASDIQTLRRVVHSLKSVLLTLGHADLADLALKAEAVAKAGSPDAVDAWRGLRALMVQRFNLQAPVDSASQH
jgi:HPt (histidine-containing phosphotransfer) domain-containing protein